MAHDTTLFKLIEKEHQRQVKGVELIASENYVSEQVMKAAGSCLTNKYAEGYPSKRYYGGCHVVDEVEQLAIDRLKELFGAFWVNVQPHSGTQANTAVYITCVNPGDTVLGLDLSHGGHLTHGSPVSFSGIMYNVHSYQQTKDGYIDYAQMERVAREVKPRLIIAGASSYTREWEYQRVRDLADELNAILWVDMAHPAGLIAAKLLDNPVHHAHIVTSTTHKTLRGPRGGIILIGEDFENPLGKKDKKGNIRPMSSVLDSAVFPGLQGGPFEHIIAAKAVAFGEALSDSFISYQQQVLVNAQTMARLLLEKGYKVISGGTDNHSILIDLRQNFPDMSGKVAEKVLDLADITTNKNMVPFDDRSPFQTSGLRIGTAAITTRGLKEREITQIVEWMDRVITHHEDAAYITKVRNEVNEMMNTFPTFSE